MNPLRILLGILGDHKLLVKSEGAKFLNESEARSVVSPRHKGPLMDGKNKRLSKDLEFRHSIILGATGSGKSTRSSIPALLDADDCSLVITDPSGDLYRKCHHSLRKKGYKIWRLDVSDFKRSVRYNPLASIASENDITDVAQVLCQEANSKDPFWTQGAMSILVVVIRVLGIAGELRMSCLIQLLESWGEQGNGIEDYVRKNSDEATWQQFDSIRSNNPRTVSGFIMTCLGCLNLFQNQDLLALMEEHEVEFDQLRKEKIAFFLSIPAAGLVRYAPLVNLIYTQLFASLMSESPEVTEKCGEKCLSVRCMLEEGGHTAIPSFALIATICRQYRISLMLYLQSLSQLEKAYPEEANVLIEGGFQNLLCYGGLPPKTSAKVSEWLGREVNTELNLRGEVTEKTGKLLEPDRVRVLQGDKALLLSSNSEPIMLDTTPYYKNRKFINQMKQKVEVYDEERELPTIRRIDLS